MSDLIIKNGILKKYKGAGGDVVIPDGVTEIAEGVFANCTALTHVTLPEGLVRIGERTFFGCTSLTSVILPESLQIIEDAAFAACPLTRLILPPAVTYIGNGAFAHCPLTEIAIGDNANWGTNDDPFRSCNDIKLVHGTPFGHSRVRLYFSLVRNIRFEADYLSFSQKS